MSHRNATANPSTSTEAEIRRIVEELKGQKAGSQWLVHCPAHDDRNPSLSITQQDGRILVHCHAGCRQQDVIAALRDRGLWRAQVPERSQGRITAIYRYTDANRQPLYEICRIEPGPNGKSKTFRQRYRDRDSGQYVWRKHPQQVLYHLPEVLEAPIVFVVEGEKDVETLREWGFVATTNAGGAEIPWLDSYTETLRGRECIVIPDNDTVGWQRATRIAKLLLGSAARIVILDLPREYKDISDWFAAGHSECELIGMVERVNAV